MGVGSPGESFRTHRLKCGRHSGADCPARFSCPARSGATARSIARFRQPVWIIAVSSQEATCQMLQFTFGVHPLYEPDHPEDWACYVRRSLEILEIAGDFAMLTEGPSSKYPEANNRMELIDLR